LYFFGCKPLQCPHASFVSNPSIEAQAIGHVTGTRNMAGVDMTNVAERELKREAEAAMRGR
jgi:hypothetical protein